MLDPRYKDHYLDAEIRQRAREMIQAALDAENPRGDGEAPSAGDRSERRKKRLVSAPDEWHAPSLSDMFSGILQESASNNNNTLAILFLYTHTNIYTYIISDCSHIYARFSARFLL